MRIFAICLVRNEQDIIRYCLERAAGWCDQIFVFDTGSTDNTWCTVTRCAAENPRIVPYNRRECHFRDYLRGEVFEEFKTRSRVGDWWCRLDADEVYIDDPRVFLAQVPQHLEVVWSASFQYYFTDVDLVRYYLQPHQYEGDGPVQNKCRYFINNWSEPRFFRYNSLLTCRGSAWPTPLGPSSPIRIRLQHFQYRSPKQILLRMETRREAIAAGLFKHETARGWVAKRVLDNERWIALHSKYAKEIDEPSRSDRFSIGASIRDHVVDSRRLSFDSGIGVYAIREPYLPKVCDIATWMSLAPNERAPSWPAQ